MVMVAVTCCVLFDRRDALASFAWLNSASTGVCVRPNPT
jgi:hypothetical protein